MRIIAFNRSQRAAMGAEDPPDRGSALLSEARLYARTGAIDERRRQDRRSPRTGDYYIEVFLTSSKKVDLGQSVAPSNIKKCKHDIFREFIFYLYIYYNDSGAYLARSR
jgi:hypothetical protein